MKLSIIICAYNTDPSYLDACIRSIKSSTLSHPEMCDRADIEHEILLIDDGSTVDYTELVKRYGLLHTKTENRGIFAARALGAELANGDYIAYFDSDDTVSFNYHLPMLLCAEEHGADIVINDWAFHTERGKYYCLNDTSITTDLEAKGKDVLRTFTAQEGKEHSYFVLWNKIYARDVLKSALASARAAANEAEGRFNYSEDALINFFAFKAAKSARNIHTGYYFYRIHNAQTVNVVSEEKLRSQIDYMALTLKIMEREAEGDEQILGNITAWRELMSRSHYSHASANKYTALYPYIKERYVVESLKKATVADGAAYAKNRLLPDNLCEYDEILLNIWKSGGANVREDAKLHPYVRKSLDFMREASLAITETDGDGVVFPSPIIPIKKKILFNPTVYKLGMLLFKKGSKIRRFLKRHL